MYSEKSERHLDRGDTVSAAWWTASVWVQLPVTRDVCREGVFVATACPLLVTTCTLHAPLATYLSLRQRTTQLSDVELRSEGKGYWFG